jgi:hypothetical protein
VGREQASQAQLSSCLLPQLIGRSTATGQQPRAERSAHPVPPAMPSLPVPVREERIVVRELHVAVEDDRQEQVDRERDDDQALEAAILSVGMV